MIETYNIHGTVIQIQSSHKELLKTIHSHWEIFYSKSCCPNPKVIFYLTRFDSTQPIRKWNYFYNDNFLTMLNPHRCVVWSLYRKPWQVYIQYVNEKDINFLYYYLFEPIFLAILKRIGLFYLHGASVTKNGCGILFPGGSESGKTTSALSLLLKAGFKILSDDDVFLKKFKLGVYTLGSDRNIFITDKTITFFPELAFLKKTPVYRKGPQLKRRIELKKLYPDSIAKKSKIHLLIFPKITSKRKTNIEPLSKTEALIKMLKQEPKEFKGLVRDDILVKEQFGIYAMLAKSARSYNLSIGEDPNSIPKTISSVL